jgi:hypothetical protein
MLGLPFVYLSGLFEMCEVCVENPEGEVGCGVTGVRFMGPLTRVTHLPAFLLHDMFFLPFPFFFPVSCGRFAKGVALCRYAKKGLYFHV